MVPVSKRKLNFVRKKILKQARERGLIGPQRYIYESPDNGKTVYRRKFNEYDKRERIK